MAPTLGTARPWDRSPPFPPFRRWRGEAAVAVPRRCALCAHGRVCAFYFVGPQPLPLQRIAFSTQKKLPALGGFVPLAHASGTKHCIHADPRHASLIKVSIGVLAEKSRHHVS